MKAPCVSVLKRVAVRLVLSLCRASLCTIDGKVADLSAFHFCVDLIVGAPSLWFENDSMISLDFLLLQRKTRESGKGSWALKRHVEFLADTRKQCILKTRKVALEERRLAVEERKLDLEERKVRAEEASNAIQAVQVDNDRRAIAVNERKVTIVQNGQRLAEKKMDVLSESRKDARKAYSEGFKIYSEGFKGFNEGFNQGEESFTKAVCSIEVPYCTTCRVKPQD